jgi:hypothetical protein
VCGITISNKQYGKNCLYAQRVSQEFCTSNKDNAIPTPAEAAQMIGYAFIDVESNPKASFI